MKSPPSDDPQPFEYLSLHLRSQLDEALPKPFVAVKAIRDGFSKQELPSEEEDGYSALLPVYDAKGRTVIRVKEQNPEEAYIISLNFKSSGSDAVVSSLQRFQDHLAAFTQNALKGLDPNQQSDDGKPMAWENVVVAGSAVLASLLPTAEGLDGPEQGKLTRLYDTELPPNLDVELYLYNLESSEEVETKTAALVKSIRSALIPHTKVHQVENTVTIDSDQQTMPAMRPVRIFQTKYRSPAEILASFDVDCCCVLYNGENVYASRRAIDAFVTQTNWVDLAYHLPDYENRLFTYAHLGFRVLCPTVDRTRVDPTLSERPSGLSGLAKIFVLAMHRTKSRHENYVLRRWSGLLGSSTARNALDSVDKFWDRTVQEWKNSEKVPDHGTDIIPHTRPWNTSKTFRPKSLGTSTIHLPGVTGRFFETGQAQIAFHSGQDTSASWTAAVHIGVPDEWCQAIASNKLDTVKHIIDPKQVNGVDCAGRTPLLLACMTSTPEIIEYLVRIGACLTTTTRGNTVLHLATARGDLGILNALQGDDEDGKLKPEVVNATSAISVSALHIAILLGRDEIVRLLVEKLKADVNQRLKVPGGRNGQPLGEIPTLALSLYLPPNDAPRMWTLLTELGADQSDELIPHYIALSGNIEILNQFESSLSAKGPDEATSARGTLNYVRQIRAFYSPQVQIYNDSYLVSSALTVAIAARDEIMALALLKRGADANIPNGPLPSFAKQPIYLAIEANMPYLAAKLLERSTQTVYTDTDKLLQMVDDRLKKLNKLRERRNAKSVSVSLPTPQGGLAATLWKGNYEDFLDDLKNVKQRQDQFIEAAQMLRDEEFHASADDPIALIESYKTLQCSLQQMATQSVSPATGLRYHAGQPTERHHTLNPTASAENAMFEATWEMNLGVILNDKNNLKMRNEWGFTCLALAALRGVGLAEEIHTHILKNYDGSDQIILEQLREPYPLRHLVENDLPQISSTVWVGGGFSVLENSDRFEVNTLSSYAIVECDCELLGFIMSAVHRASKSLDRPDPALRADVALAIALNHENCLKTIIQETGIGLFPSRSLVASALGHNPDEPGIAWQDHPLLIAAQQGKQNITLWMWHGGAKKQYEHYVEKHAKGHLPCSLPDPIKSLILHYIVMSQPSDEALGLLKHFAEEFGEEYPQYLEKTAFGGRTPLALACSLRRMEFVEVLIDQGANPRVRDAQGRNLLHLMLFSMPRRVCERSSDIKSIVGLLGNDIVSEMLDETTDIGCMTPFALWVHAYATFKDGAGEDTDIPEYLMSLGPTEHLATFDAFGNTPIHTSVANGLYSVLEQVLPGGTQFLHHENVWGITPIELAQFKFVESVASKWIDHTTWDLYHRESFEPHREFSRQRSVWALCSQYQSGKFPRRVVTLKEAQKAVSHTSKMEGKSVRDLIECFCGDKVFWSDMVSRWWFGS